MQGFSQYSNSCIIGRRKHEFLADTQLHIGGHVNNTEGNIKIWNSSQQPLHYDAMLL